MLPQAVSGQARQGHHVDSIRPEGTTTVLDFWTTRPLAVTRTLKTLIATGLLAGLVALLTAAPASAGTPCWKTLINDWYDGRIDSIYPIHCYREALKHLPEDVQTYSSARDDITRALQARIAGKGNGPQPPKGGKHSAGGGVPAKGSGGGPAERNRGAHGGGRRPLANNFPTAG